MLFPDAEVATMGVSAFDQQKTETPVSKDVNATAYVRCVAEQLLTATGQKIGVYSGLSPLSASARSTV